MYSIHFLSYFKRESFSALTIFCISASQHFIEKQIILYNFHFSYIFFLSMKKNCSTKKKIMSILSISDRVTVGLRMDFHVAKMAVELFFRHCAIAALSLTAIVHLR